MAGREGVMQKEEGLFKSWKLRHFELKDQTLFCFDKKGGKLQGKFLLKGASLDFATQKAAKAPNSFKLQTGSSTWFLNVTDKDEQREWMYELTQQGAKLAHDKRLTEFVMGDKNKPEQSSSNSAQVKPQQAPVNNVVAGTQSSSSSNAVPTAQTDEKSKQPEEKSIKKAESEPIAEAEKSASSKESEDSDSESDNEQEQPQEMMPDASFLMNLMKKSQGQQAAQSDDQKDQQEFDSDNDYDVDSEDGSTEKEPTSVEDALQQLAAHPKNRKVFASSIHYLCRMYEGEDISQTILSNEGIQAIVKAAKFHKRKQELMTETLSILLKVSASDKIPLPRTLIRSSGFVSLAGHLFKMYNDEESYPLLFSTLKVLSNALYRPSEHNAQFMKRPAFVYFMEVLEGNMSNFEFASEALLMFTNIISSKANVELFCEKGGVTVMVSILKEHAEKTEAILAHFNAFTARVKAHDAVEFVAPYMADDGGVETILSECLIKHFKEQKIVQLSMQIVKNLAEHNSTVSAILRVLQKNMKNLEAAVNLTTMLYNLRTHAYLSAFEGTEAIPVLTETLSNNTSEGWVIKFGLETVNFLIAQSTEYQEQFVKCKGVTPTMKVVTGFASNPELCNIALQALAILSENESLRPAVAAETFGLRAIMRAINSNDSDVDLLRNAIKILADILSVTDELDRDLVTDMVPKMFSLLERKKTSLPITEKTLMALSHICDKDEVIILGEEDMKRIMACLEEHKDSEDFVSSAFLLISKLANASDNGDLFAKHKCGDLLANLIKTYESSELVQNSAAELKEMVESWQ